MRRTAVRLAAVCAAVALTASCSPRPAGIGAIVYPMEDEPGDTPAPVLPPRPEKPRLAEHPAETHQGKNTATVPLTWPSGVSGFLTFDCPKCTGHVAVTTDGTESLLVNDGDAYHGTAWFNVSPGGTSVHTLAVEATGSWTATITDYRGVPAVEPGKPYNGHGDAVLAVPPGMVMGKFFTGSKGSNGVWVLADGYPRLAVNHIGETTGEFALTGPTYVAVETFEAEWTFTAW
ncbi:hypothetical protein G3I59_26195 [Amycolatopsis rubida]|uniref:Lipoprotein n=1 Tax=Amycolatopsis rubida TaxID=112413 RepID=A0ABX0C1Q9_9PSEU|nr:MULTISPECIES: hypothetical protein [Amycolatopsis]MYW94001.1 hypothetical protein [Amycolatopsis rubida]NEC58990.1 hypothetical protein [Amycolatopsis rubida]OAP22126.1 hypothetical protein A4R44_07244 [Amycolatopsis sp. M39]